MSKLSNKVAVITGGNSGIGFATAQVFLARGAKVVITGRNQQAVGDAVKRLGHDGHALGVVADQGKIGDIDAVFEAAVARFGKIDVLFINAGVAKIGPVDAMAEDAFDEMMNVNFKGPYFMIQKALPHMNDGGAIVLNTSINATIGMPATSAYAASKAALSSLIRTLSTDLMARRIRVNAVSPGPVDTPLYGKTGLPAEAIQGFAQSVQAQIPLKRFGRPEEIAQAVAFLASDESSFILGTELVADGGMSQL